MIDTSKPVKFYDDRGKVSMPVFMSKVLYQDDTVCLCLTDENMKILFSLDTGEVLTEDLQFWFAANDEENEDKKEEPDTTTAKEQWIDKIIARVLEKASKNRFSLATTHENLVKQYCYYYQCGQHGRIPDAWLEVQDELQQEEKEYKEYVRLKEKFGG